MRSVEDVLVPDVLASSRGRVSPGFDVMTARIPQRVLEIDGLTTHTLAINVGRPFRVEGKVDGRATSGLFPAGAMKLVEAGPRSTWQWDDGRPIEMLHVSVSDDLLQTCAGELDVRGRIDVSTSVGFVDDDLARISGLLSAEVQSSAVRSLVADALRIEIITRLIGQYSSLPPGASALRAPRNRLGMRALRLLEDYIEEHLAGDMSIGDLAAVAGLSRFHFVRLFRSTVGITPYRYVLERRLERARVLLSGSGSALRDIAAATGFADQSHLTREIKRRYGVTPGTLRAG